MMVDTLTIARALPAAIGRSVTESATTKPDLEDLRVTLKADTEALRHELRTEIERARNQVLIWVVSTQIAVGGLIIAVMKL